MASSASSSTPATPGRLAREKSMAVVASDYINVVRRATELDCVAPSDLALITRYFETAEPRDELLHESHASTLRKLWRAAGVDATPVEPPDETFPEVSESAFDLLLPTIFVGSLLLSEDPDGVSLALGVVANYVTDFLQGHHGRAQGPTRCRRRGGARPQVPAYSIRGASRGSPHDRRHRPRYRSNVSVLQDFGRRSNRSPTSASGSAMRRELGSTKSRQRTAGRSSRRSLHAQGPRYRVSLRRPGEWVP